MLEFKPGTPRLNKMVAPILLAAGLIFLVFIVFSLGKAAH